MVILYGVPTINKGSCGMTVKWMCAMEQLLMAIMGMQQLLSIHISWDAGALAILLLTLNNAQLMEENVDESRHTSIFMRQQSVFSCSH
jgi:hypothetical protein